VRRARAHAAQAFNASIRMMSASATRGKYCALLRKMFIDTRMVDRGSGVFRPSYLPVYHHVGDIKHTAIRALPAAITPCYFALLQPTPPAATRHDAQAHSGRAVSLLPLRCCRRQPLRALCLRQALCGARYVCLCANTYMAQAQCAR